MRAAFFPKQIKFEKRKELKKMKSEELMPIAWYPKIWWNFYVSEDEKVKDEGL